MVNFDIKPFLPDFLTAAKSDLQSINNYLSAINSENISDIHRLYHSLKGKCLFLGFTQTGELAKQLEYLFAKIKDNPGLLTAPITETIKAVTSQLVQSISAIETTGQENNLQTQIEIVKQLTN